MVINRIKNIFIKYPLTKGMLAYSIMWPTGNIIQQTMVGKRWGNLFYFEKIILVARTSRFILLLIIFPHTIDTYDWGKCVRFSLYGSLFVAPTLYGWVRITTVIWPVSNFRTAITKAVVEQCTYGPMATACFFFFMSLLESKTIEESKTEVVEKLLPTVKVRYYQFVF